MASPDYRKMARQAALQAGIDPDIFERQIQTESGFDPTQVSPAGARGIAQIVPKWHPGVNPDDPQASLTYAANLMASYLKGNGGNWAAALSDYNAGPYASNKNARGVAQNSETINYVNNILGGDGVTQPPTYSLTPWGVTSTGKIGGIPSSTSASQNDPTAGLHEIRLGSGRYILVDAYGNTVGAPYSDSKTSNPDHFFDLSPQDQQAILNEADKNRIDQRNYDYKVGRDAIDDWRYDQEHTYQQGRDAFNDNLALTQAGRLQQVADNNYQQGMATAQTAQDRENVTAAYNRELANIALMNNETTTRNNEQQNQTSQFGAETNRARDMGQLALDNNKFILDASGKPHNMWALFAMERGVAPDWATMRAGGTPAQGASLAPADVMHAYVPTTAPPQFNQNWRPQAAANVGTYSAAAVPKANPWLATDYKAAPPAVPLPQAPTPAAPVRTPQPQVPPASTTTTTANDPYHSGGNTWSDDGTAGGRWTDSSGHYQSNGGGWMNPDGTPYTRMDGGGFTDSPLVMAGDSIHADPEADGAKPETIWNPTRAPLAIKPNPQNVAEMSAGGNMGQPAAPVSAPGRMANGIAAPVGQEMMNRRPVGGAYDYLSQVDRAAGRTPMMGDNHYRMLKMGDYMGRSFRPTPGMFRRPDRVTDMQPRRFAAGTMPGPSFPANRRPLPDDGSDFDPKWAQTNMGANPAYPPDPPTPGIGEPGGPNMPLGGPSLGDAGWPAPEVPFETGDATGNAIHTGTVGVSAGVQSIIDKMLNLLLRSNAGSDAGGGTEDGGSLDGHFPARYALGTDNSAAFANAGMGGAYVPSSNNSYLAGQNLPPALRMMVDAGMAIPPGVAAAIIGSNGAALNFGAANTASGAGVLASGQGLRNMGKNERESYEGFLDGPGGSDSKEAEDWVFKPTENLQQAAIARAGY